MKILALADIEDESLWSFYDESKTEGVDLIVSCGDLAPEYLEFLVTIANIPVIYVRGNHDTKYDRKPPTGCQCIEDQVYTFKGVRFLGLGGSMRYHGGKDMYTEKEMAKRIRKRRLELFWKKGFDVLLTHAPAAGWGDMEDLPHQGFECFNPLLEKWKPKYMLHGHVHKDYGHFQREQVHNSGTKIINCWKQYLLEI